MFKNFSIRARMTLLSACLLTLCCIGLTLVLNASAYRAIETIEATPVTPSHSVDEVYAASAFVFPTQESVLAKKGLQVESLMAMFGFIVLGSSLTYLAVGKSLEPLEILNEQIKNMNVSNLSEQLSIPNTHDEIAELSASFNVMSQKMNAIFLTQKRFAASAAHELKTPLTVLQTKLDVFQKHSEPSVEAYEGLLAVFAKQTQRLRDLVESLLSMTHRDQDMQNQREIVLSELLDEVCDDLEVIASESSVAIALDCDDSRVIGLNDLLYRAFYNLVENAIKYNHEGGHVSITVKALDSDHVRIRICDDGLGIDPSLAAEIFEPFYRIDASRSREVGGAGLGLAIVKEIIDQHDGSIALVDTQQTCFEIIL